MLCSDRGNERLEDVGVGDVQLLQECEEALIQVLPCDVGLPCDPLGELRPDIPDEFGKHMNNVKLGLEPQLVGLLDEGDRRHGPRAGEDDDSSS